jgi:hypothetical protein
MNLRQGPKEIRKRRKNKTNDVRIPHSLTETPLVFQPFWIREEKRREERRTIDDVSKAPLLLRYRYLIGSGL